MNGDKPSAEIGDSSLKILYGKAGGPPSLKLWRAHPSPFLIMKGGFAIRSLWRRMVGERSYCSEAQTVKSGGAVGSENVGMSSASPVKNRTAVNPRFPSQR